MIAIGLMLLVLQLAVGVFGDSHVSNAIDDMVAFIPKLVVAIVIVIKFGVGGIWAARDRFWPAVYDQVASEGSPDAAANAD